MSVLMIDAVMAEEKPLISRRDYGTDVIALYKKLIELGLFTLRTESPWGPKSEDALKVLQSVLGWNETGVVDNREQLDAIMAYEHEPFSAVEIAKSRIIKNLFVDPVFSAGASETDSGFTFITDVEDNAFNAVQWQLMNSNGEYIETFASGGSGVHESVYFFTHVSGEYLVRLKANSSKKDESVYVKLHLVQGQSYHFIYSVILLEAQKVVVSDVAFGEKKN